MNYQQLWAPWRLAYISADLEKQGTERQRPRADEDSACFICRGAVGDDDRGRLVVQHGPHSLTILNRYPYNNGHLLVAPKRHVARLDELTADESLDICQTIAQMIGLLERTIRAEGFNVGLNLGRVAGAGLPGHVHWHIVPRWNGDTNFMPVTAGIRVIPQSLEALWEILTNALAGGEQGAGSKERGVEN